MRQDLSFFVISGKVLEVKIGENKRGNTVCTWILGIHPKSSKAKDSDKMCQMSFRVFNFGEENKGLAKLFYRKLKSSSYVIVEGSIEPYEYQDKWYAGFHVKNIIPTNETSTTATNSAPTIDEDSLPF